jgi:splicing factor 3A subunit 1
LAGADVSASLRRLAAQRTDIFSEVGLTDAQKRKAAEEARKLSKAREANVWDGHVASGQLTTDRFNNAAAMGGQIDALHRSKGLGEAAGPAPHIGPAGFVVPVPIPTSAMPIVAPANMTGASLSAAPQAGLSNPYTYNPGEATGLPYSGVQVPGPVAPVAMSFAAQPVSAATRPAEAAPDGEPSAKRARVERLPEGRFHDEETWLASHPVRCASRCGRYKRLTALCAQDPVTIMVQLPNYPDNPKWKCDGQKLPLESVPLNSSVGTLRDRIQVSHFQGLSHDAESGDRPRRRYRSAGSRSSSTTGS